MTQTIVRRYDRAPACKNEPMANLQVAVIGGGIGGLSAALAMLKAGCDVHVFEAAPKFGEIGAGIQISPNASRLLYRLGLKAAMEACGVRPVAVHQRRWDDGRTLQRAPLGADVEAAFGAPYYHFHRGDLAALLAAALPAERAHAGHRLVDIEEKGERVIAHFEEHFVLCIHDTPPAIRIVAEE